MVLGPTGNLGIGVSSPSQKLEVNGTIKTKEVNITTTGWADYVFKPEWGSEAAGEDIAAGDDPFAAIAEWYRRHAIGPRTPLATVRQRMQPLLDDVDAVVVVVPPDDTVFGWDYPCLRAWLEARRLPHVCLFAHSSRPPGPVEHERIAGLVAAATERVGARHG
jgi:hypothetical protein